MNEDGVIAVLVVYERNLEQTKPWQQLCTMLLSSASSRLHLKHVLIYDNSVEPRFKPPIIMNCSYVHDSKNGGTAAAYACACRLAQELGLGWLLLMDHDTAIPKDLLEHASVAVSADSERPAALLPWVVHGERPISPATVTWSGSIRPVSHKWNVAEPPKLTGVASASLIDSASLLAICPFPRTLWLDYVDHWIFAQLQARGGKVVVFNAMVQHDLSIFDLTTVSRDRLHTILEGEALFVRSLPLRVRIFQPFRLGVRLLRFSVRHPASALDMLLWFCRRWKVSR